MRNIYQEVTDRIINALEQEMVPWQRPWADGNGMPHNLSTDRYYRGINVPLLWCSQFDRGFESDRWLTLRQANTLGARVKKGSKGTAIIFWKTRTIRVEGADEPEATIPVARVYSVFNEDQIDGLPVRDKPVAEWDPHVEAEKLMDRATVVHGGDRAFYAPNSDIIQLPPVEAFTDQGAYYSTALHELTHWTGHSSRLDRLKKGSTGGTDYAQEELVAEMGAAFLCAQLGIGGKLQHPEYIGHWLKVLKEDNRSVFRASSAAQKAVDYIVGAE
jgi:antirestriction protein ArdC